MIRTLVEQGANVNAKAKDGTTPLVLAATWCQVDEVKYLVSRGANPNPKDGDGKPLLGFLSSAPSSDMLSYLKRNCYPELKDFLDNLKHKEK